MRASDGRRGSALRELILAVLGAALIVLSFAPFDLWPLIVLAPWPLLELARSTARWRPLLFVFLTSSVAWWWLDHWMWDVTVPGYLAKGPYAAVFSVLFVAIVRRGDRQGWPLTILAPVTWVGLETLRGLVAFGGYPWYFLAHPLIEWPVLAQTADLFGVWFVSFVAAAAAGGMADVVRRRPWPALAAVALVLFDIGYGVWRMTPAAMPGPTVLVVQTNVPSSNKSAWTIDQKHEDFTSFVELTQEALAAVGGPVDLVVWPETMLPGLGLEQDTIAHLRSFGPAEAHRYRFAESLAEWQRIWQVPVLAGSLSWVDPELVEVVQDGQRGVRLEPGAIYNSAYLVAGEPPYPRYDKIHLTPFGEEIPYLARWPWLQDKLVAFGAPGLSFGLDRSPVINRIPLVDSGVVLATPICFEDTMSGVCRRLVYDGGVKEAALLVNLSNDGWFGRDDSGRIHHAQNARYRAIENRVPLIRAANTGCSLAIDSRGVVVERVGAGRYGTTRTAGWLVAHVALDDRVSWYGRLGDVWAWACLAGMLPILLIPFPTSRRQG